MNTSETMSRYCRVALYTQHAGVGCRRPAVSRRTGVSESERARQLATLRADHRIAGQSWNPR